MKLFELRNTTDNTKVTETIASTLKEAKEFWAYIINDTPKHIKLKVIEVGVHVKSRNIYYADLKLLIEKEVKSITPAMMLCILNQDFSNDNQTFFMLERGLVNEDRVSLTEKGKELLKVWAK